MPVFFAFCRNYTLESEQLMNRTAHARTPSTTPAFASSPSHASCSRVSRLTIVAAALLFGAASAVAITLTVDRTSYMVGESAVYHVEGAPPNSAITWSSWLNGASTGEVNANYGQVTDGSGRWTALAGTFVAAHVGNWVKQ